MFKKRGRCRNSRAEPFSPCLCWLAAPTVCWEERLTSQQAPALRLPRWKHFWQYKSVSNGDHYRNKRARLSSSQRFHAKASTTHRCLWERGVKGTPALLGTTTVEGEVEVHFQMTSGSTALRWVSEEEPPQRSLTPLYCLAELLLAASLLLPYFLGKLQKFTAFSQCPQQQFWATCTTTALIKPYKEKLKDDRQHFSLFLVWVRAEPDFAWGGEGEYQRVSMNLTSM